MQTIDEIFQAEYEAKKSNFFAFLTPWSEFEKQKKALKQAHPKAAHIVWAYRILNEFEQIVENQSDDGEPKGTSGPPCLNVLRGSELVNCGVLVVRYFGGIKLGTGGLVRAYGASVNEVIKKASLRAYEKLTCKKFHVSFSLLPRLEHFFKANSFPSGKKNFDEKGVLWKMEVSKREVELLASFVKEYEYLGKEGIVFL